MLLKLILAVFLVVLFALAFILLEPEPKSLDEITKIEREQLLSELKENAWDTCLWTKDGARINFNRIMNSVQNEILKEEGKEALNIYPGLRSQPKV